MSAKPQVSVAQNGKVFISKTLEDSTAYSVAVTRAQASDLIAELQDSGLTALPNMGLIENDLSSLIERLHETLRQIDSGKELAIPRHESDGDEEQLPVTTLEEAEAIAQARLEVKLMQDDAAHIQSKSKQTRRQDNS